MFPLLLLKNSPFRKNIVYHDKTSGKCCKIEITRNFGDISSVSHINLGFISGIYQVYVWHLSYISVPALSIMMKKTYRQLTRRMYGGTTDFLAKTIFKEENENVSASSMLLMTRHLLLGKLHRTLWGHKCFLSFSPETNLAFSYVRNLIASQHLHRICACYNERHIQQIPGYCQAQLKLSLQL